MFVVSVKMVAVEYVQDLFADLFHTFFLNDTVFDHTGMIGTLLV